RELARAVERVDDPHALGAESNGVVLRLLRQHRVLGSLASELGEDQLVAREVAAAARRLVVDALGLCGRAYLEQQLTGPLRDRGGQLVVGRSRHASDAAAASSRARRSVQSASKRFAVRRSVPGSTGFTSTASTSARAARKRSASRSSSSRIV